MAVGVEKAEGGAVRLIERNSGDGSEEGKE